MKALVLSLLCSIPALVLFGCAPMILAYGNPTYVLRLCLTWTVFTTLLWVFLFRPAAVDQNAGRLILVCGICCLGLVTLLEVSHVISMGMYNASRVEAFGQALSGVGGNVRLAVELEDLNSGLSVNSYLLSGAVWLIVLGVGLMVMPPRCPAEKCPPQPVVQKTPPDAKPDLAGTDPLT
ncbi:hypothetical protein [Lignipirellula cremea]|uniref:Uncharacterized protein n=1 Tax=Lignipirellula cremea TaxID=2528010 RepID=A0A518DTD7_9BACT|nr:hypothetical protein [Lignipirellula cremea]QDU95107.1 hypothetical protein Pla8534_29190 [Lignipirellula cremea]